MPLVSTKVAIKINHREILFALASYVGLEEKKIAFCAEIDKLDKIGKEAVLKKIVEMGAEKDKMEEVMHLLSEPIREIEALESINKKIKSIDASNTGIDEVSELFRSVSNFNKSTFRC